MIGGSPRRSLTTSTGNNLNTLETTTVGTSLRDGWYRTNDTTCAHGATGLSQTSKRSRCMFAAADTTSTLSLSPRPRLQQSGDTEVHTRATSHERLISRSARRTALPATTSDVMYVVVSRETARERICSYTDYTTRCAKCSRDLELHISAMMASSSGRNLAAILVAPRLAGTFHAPVGLWILDPAHPDGGRCPPHSRRV